MGISAQAVTWALRFVLALPLCLGLMTAQSRAQEDARPPAGLLWNKTGLPAVFPLQIKTVPGRDHVVTLLDAGTGEAALAAYIRGGVFFRVLVPPGAYRLRFVSGTNWQGAAALFGSEVERFELRRILRFETRGLGTKAGHIVDLRGQGAEAQIKDHRICQSFRPDFPRLLVPDHPVRPQRRDVRSRYCG